MPIFLLIRHGETDYNKKMHLPGRLPNVHLNKKGIQQAQILANMLARAPIKAIYSSPLDRTLETAAPLASLLKLEVIPTPGLLETDCGEWQGQSVKKLRRQKVWKSVQQHPSLFHFPGGESIVDCQHRPECGRAHNRFRELSAAHPKERRICQPRVDPVQGSAPDQTQMPV